MENIASTKNEYVKTLRALKMAKYRKESGLFLAEGEKCAREALLSGRAEALLATEKYLSLLTEAEAAGVRAVVVSAAVIEALSEVKTPEGAVAVAARREERAPDKGLLVCLENLSDPANVGAVIRTADAAGAAGVLLSPTSADFTSSRAVRASMGSLFHLSIECPEDFYGRLASLKEQGFLIAGGHLKGESRFSRQEDMALLIGNESRGLTDQAAALCGQLVKISMYGKAESLNAAVAAGILIYRAKEGF